MDANGEPGAYRLLQGLEPYIGKDERGGDSDEESNGVDAAAPVPPQEDHNGHGDPGQGSDQALEEARGHGGTCGFGLQGIDPEQECGSTKEGSG